MTSQADMCSQVDILIAATDTYVPVPSMSAMVANRFKMRGDLRNYSLGGQGCSSGIIAVELAQQLLKVMPIIYSMLSLVHCTGSCQCIQLPILIY